MSGLDAGVSVNSMNYLLLLNYLLFNYLLLLKKKLLASYKPTRDKKDYYSQQDEPVHAAPICLQVLVGQIFQPSIVEFKS